MYKIVDIAKEISSGLTPLRSNSEYWDNGTIPWLKTEQIGEYRIKTTNEFVTEKALESTGLKLYPKNTISIAMYGEGKTRGNVSIIDCPMTTNQACCNIVVNESIVDPFYLYYFFKTQYHNLRQLSSGVRKNLNSNDIKNYLINLPNKTTQQNIVNFLCAIDEKIELNNKINSELERIAKTLYEYWFVQFDFPDENERPYKSSGGKMYYDEKYKRSIPLNWKIQNFNTNDLTEIIQPGINKFENEKVYLPTANIQDDKIVDFSYKITYENRESRANMQPISNSVWFAKMKNSKKILYFANYSQEYLNKLVLSTGLCGLYCKNNTFEYIWNTVNSEYFEKRKDSLAHGATQEAINNDDLISMPLLVPPISIVEKYYNKTKELYYQKYLNELENQKLVKLRDWLLPMLMNGQISITAE